MISIYVTPIISGIFFLLVVDACHESAWDTLQMRFFGSPGGFPYGYIMISIYATPIISGRRFFPGRVQDQGRIGCGGSGGGWCGGSGSGQR